MNICVCLRVAVCVCIVNCCYCFYIADVYPVFSCVGVGVRVCLCEDFILCRGKRSKKVISAITQWCVVGTADKHWAYSVQKSLHCLRLGSIFCDIIVNCLWFSITRKQPTYARISPSLFGDGGSNTETTMIFIYINKTLYKPIKLTQCVCENENENETDGGGEAGSGETKYLSHRMGIDGTRMKRNPHIQCTMYIMCCLLCTVHALRTCRKYYVFKMFFISLLNGAVYKMESESIAICVYATYPNALIDKIVSFALFAPSCASSRSSPIHPNWFCCLHVRKSYPSTATAWMVWLVVVIFPQNSWNQHKW